MRSVLTTARKGIVAIAIVVSACGSSSTSPEPDAGAVARPTVVVTTNILADVAEQAFGAAVDVELIMPVGADPHDFAPSARQAESMENADLLLINGAGFEAGMLDVIDAVVESGTPLFVAADAVELLSAGSGDDPHFWTDPTQMIRVVDALETRLGGLVADDTAATEVTTGADAYRSELVAADGEVSDVLTSVPAERRVLVTNHEVFSYFALRYGFEVVGAIVPSFTTGAEPSAADLDDLADVIEAEGVPAIFAETSQSTDLADALADEVGDIEVIELFSESLGESGSGAETYVAMLQTNAQLIAAALGGTE